MTTIPNASIIVGGQQQMWRAYWTFCSMWGPHPKDTAQNCQCFFLLLFGPRLLLEAGLGDRHGVLAHLKQVNEVTPPLVLTDDCATPVAEFTATASARGMIAPDESATDPVIFPTSVCCALRAKPPKSVTTSLSNIPLEIPTCSSFFCTHFVITIARSQAK